MNEGGFVYLLTFQSIMYYIIVTSQITKEHSMLEESFNDEEISFVEQSVFDRFIQASKHLRSQYNMQLSIHDAIILDALLRHYTVRAAAQELRITPHTLSNYQHALLKRFNCQNRQELRIYCQKRGWSTPIIAVAARTSVKHLPDTTDY